MIKQSKFMVLLVLMASATLSCQSQEPAPIKWMSFEEAVAASGKNPKKLFIDVYTEWCGWCKKMDKSTFADPAVAYYINEHFYPVKLDAETKDTIRFRDQLFVFEPQYKANTLAASLLGGKMGYPSYVILDEKFALVTQPLQGYMSTTQIMPTLRYYAENIYKEKTWEEFESGK
ncbi:MAG: thioredoxin family protein [Arcticibacter sp.]